MIAKVFWPVFLIIVVWLGKLRIAQLLILRRFPFLLVTLLLILSSFPLAFLLGQLPGVLHCLLLRQPPPAVAPGPG